MVLKKGWDLSKAEARALEKLKERVRSRVKEALNAPPRSHDEIMYEGCRFCAKAGRPHTGINATRRPNANRLMPWL